MIVTGSGQHMAAVGRKSAAGGVSIASLQFAGFADYWIPDQGSGYEADHHWIVDGTDADQTFVQSFPFIVPSTIPVRTFQTRSCSLSIFIMLTIFDSWLHTGQS